jgi:hypothetical protein
MNNNKTRIQILDRLSKKWGRKIEPTCNNFDDFCIYFDSEAILILVYAAMSEYAKQHHNHMTKKNNK